TDTCLLWRSDASTRTAGGKQGILEQLGRMLIQDKFSQDDCITIASFAIQALNKCYPGRTALVQPAPGGGVYSGEEEKVTCSERHSRDRRPSWGWRPAR